MRKFFKSLLAIVSGILSLLGIAYLLLMVNTTAGFAGVIILPFVLGMAFKTSKKIGLLAYPVLISIPITVGLGLFTYNTGSIVAFVFAPAGLLSAVVGNYLTYHVDSWISKKSLQLLGGYVAICILLLVAVIPKIHVLDVSEKVSEPLPEAELITTNGEVVSVSELEGDIVVVDFWATWCGKCIQMIPELERLEEKYSENPKVTFIAVNTAQGDSFEDMKMFASEKEVEIDFLYDEETQFTDKMGIGGVPYTAIIDMVEKRIKVRKHGYAPGEDYVGVVSKHIDSLLEPSEQS